MKKRYLAFFVIIIALIYFKLNTNELPSEPELTEITPAPIQKTTPVDPPKIQLNNKPSQEKIEEQKKTYFTKTEFEKIQSEVTDTFKQADKDLTMINHSEDRIEISFGKGIESINDIDTFLYLLNLNLYSRDADYKAFFNRDTKQIEIQRLEDFLVNLSEKINSKSKKITDVKLEYETPLAKKSIACVTGAEREEQEIFHLKNHCDTSDLSINELKNVILNFYKNSTPSKNMAIIQSEILPLWDDIYGKKEDLRNAQQHTFLCHPNSKTISMELGCNFRLKMIMK